MALAGLSAVFLFEMLDNSILNVALPTIGRELHASTTALQWVTGAYAVVFGGLMLAFGALADRFGRRRIMLIGLALLGVASLATAFVTTAEQLIAVRAAMGVAAAMTTPGSMALAFRLFDEDGLRVRATTLISTVGLVGLAIGPTVGGFVLAVAPWQVLLLVNVPIAVLAIVGVRPASPPTTRPSCTATRWTSPGAVLGTATIVLALVAPTLFVERGRRLLGARGRPPRRPSSAAVLFVLRERTARYPLLDLPLVARPLVSSGLAYKAAAGLATAGLGYLVTLQLQLDWGWTPALAAIGMLPQVVVLARAAARSSTRSCTGSVSSGPPGSAPPRSCSGSPSTACSAASATSGSRRARAGGRRDARGRRRRRGQRAARPAEEPHHDRRGPRRHGHRGHLRRRHRRHRHHPRRAVHR